MATGDKPHEYYRGAREERSNLDLIRESFSDPVFEMFTTLGVFNFKDQPDGGFEILADAYDFNASKSPKNRVAMDSYSQAVYDAQDISGDQSYRFNVSGIVSPKTVNDLINPQPGEVEISFGEEPDSLIDARPKPRPETPQPDGTVLTGTPASSIDSMLEDRPEPEPDIPAPTLDSVARPEIDAETGKLDFKVNLLSQQELEAALDPAKPIPARDDVETRQLEDIPEPAPRPMPRPDTEEEVEAATPIGRTT